MKKIPFQERLAAAFQAHPDAVAIEYGRSRFTYSQIEQRARQVTGKILSMDTEKGTFIGIGLDDRVDFICSFIGVLNAGCVAVPLDPALPRTRLEQMIRRLDLSLTIDDTFYREALDAPDTGDLAPVPFTPTDPIYVYFTSGSTGEPKAIVGQNKGLRHFIDWEIDTFGLDQTVRVSQFTTVGFDAFLRDVFVPLCAGGVLCIPEDNGILANDDAMSQWIRDNRIHLVHCVPSLFKHFGSGQADPQCFNRLKYVLLSGERLTAALLNPWFRSVGEKVQLVNLYGPSETTMVKTFHRIGKQDLENEKIPIGAPMKGARVFLFDKTMNVCDRGVVGEIYIRTPFRTLGYYNDPDANRERFIPNPFTGDENDLFYKTGDLGMEGLNGVLHFLGRMDRQVKIMGVRVEPGEVESALLKHPGIAEAVVIVLENRDKPPALCACIVTGENTDIAAAREFLFNSVPEYMIPSFIIPVQSIPHLPNGKVDRISLQENVKRELNKTRYRAPRDPVEEKLARAWSKVLDMDKIGIHDDFFQLGGHSMEMIKLANEVKASFDVELEIIQMFKQPDIKSMAHLIRTHGSGDSNDLNEEPFIRFNENKHHHLFLFPPQIGSGVAYKELAGLIPDCALTAFNYLDREDRLDIYAREIQRIQPNGPLALFGYSAGGNLAFDVAKTLEKNNRAVSAVIIVDSFSKPVPMVLGTQEERERFFDVAEQEVEHLGLGYLKDKIIRNSKQYTRYYEHSVTHGRISAAIHLITSADRDRRRQQLQPLEPGGPLALHHTDWQDRTSAQYTVHKGKGEHIAMFGHRSGKKNIAIINSILTKIYGKS